MDKETKYLIKKLVRQIAICCGLIVLTIALTLHFHFDAFSKDPIPWEEITLELIDSKYDISLLDNSNESTAIKFGHDLFINTPKFIGPEMVIQIWFLRETGCLVTIVIYKPVLNLFPGH